MLCVSICPKNEQQLLEGFNKAKQYGACVEIRLDAMTCLPELDVSVSCMLTIMDNEQTDFALSLASHEPAWISLPYDMPLDVFKEIKKRHPQGKIIAAYHDFEKTSDIHAIFELCRAIPCDMIKIVTQANSSLDSLRMMAFLKNYSGQVPLTAFCMGKFGVFSRVIAPLYGSAITYCSLPGKPTASGQLTADELLHTYNYQALSRDTELFALIGSPIDHSLSHRTHNAVFRKVGRDAVYVKIPLVRSEFEEGFELLRLLGLQGLSVTRPLKDCFTPPSNTVLCHKEGIEVCNTDGTGMADALEQYGVLTGKRAIILGAGPTAYAIAKELLMRGATVIVANRTEAKAQSMAKELECLYAPWDLETLLSKPYDILVNATCVGMVGEESGLPIQEADLHPTALIADVVSSSETELIRMAKRRGCTTVSGQEMWLHQAARQFHFWGGHAPTEILPFLREQVNAYSPH